LGKTDATLSEANFTVKLSGLNELSKAGAKGGVTAGEAGVDTAGSIRNVNPGYPTTGRTQNCVNCSVATDATLSGTPTSALPSTGPVPIPVLERQYGATFGAPASSSALATQMENAGNGARGIVFGSRGPGEIGHVFNVVNQGGVIRFLDGQTGMPALLDGFTNFRLLRTNKP
jgi:filamentous hemagglutinin